MMARLRQFLLKPMEANDRTRAYQAVLDACLDRLIDRFDIERGLIDAKGVALPHESVPGFWDLPHAERRRHATPATARVYLLTKPHACRPLTPEQVADLKRRYPAG